MNTCLSCHRLQFGTSGLPWVGCSVGRWYTTEQAGVAAEVGQADSCGDYASVTAPPPPEIASQALGLIASARAMTRPESIPAEMTLAADAGQLLVLAREVNAQAVVITVAPSQDSPMVADLIIPHTAGVNPMRMTVSELVRVAHETGGA